MFIADGELLRQVNPQYREHFDHLIDSGLYQELVDAHLLIRTTRSPSNELWKQAPTR